MTADEEDAVIARFMKVEPRTYRTFEALQEPLGVLMREHGYTGWGFDCDYTTHDAYLVSPGERLVYGGGRDPIEALRAAVFAAIEAVS